MKGRTVEVDSKHVGNEMKMKLEELAARPEGGKVIFSLYTGTGEFGAGVSVPN